MIIFTEEDLSKLKNMLNESTMKEEINKIFIRVCFKPFAYEIDLLKTYFEMFTSEICVGKSYSEFDIECVASGVSEKFLDEMGKNLTEDEFFELLDIQDNGEILVEWFVEKLDDEKEETE